MNILIRNVKYSLAFVILLNGLTILMARAEDDFSSLDTRHYSSSVYGGVGLLQIPTARFSGDGDFLFGISTESPWHRLYSKVQFLPWMEAVLRYTDATYKPYNPGSGQTWKDKAFDVRFRLSEEGQYMPAIAFGLTDLGGTGAYASEFFVASKFINNIDYTLGIGWGRFGGKDHFSNPLKFINDGKGSNDELGGTLSFAQFFKDSKPAMFAGIEYFTPIENLSLKLEYDTSDYSDVDGLPRHMNKEGDIFKVQSAFNIGLTYRKVFSKRNYADLSFGLMRGNTFYANVTAATDLNLKNRLKIKIPKEILNTPYLEEFSTLTPEWQKYLADLIAWQMSNEGMVAHNVIFNDNELIAEVTQGRFLNPVHGIDLAARILGNNSPKNISQITVVNIDQGIETFRATIARDDLVKSVARGPIAEEIIDYNSYEDLSSEAYIMPNDALYPHFSWSIRPIIAGTLQHQIAFYLWDVQALVKAEYAIRKGIYLNLDYGIGIGGNFDDYLWHVPDGSLHHVRQDRRLYLTEGRNGIRRLALDYLFEVNEEIKGRISTGYLEWMYGGIGGELIYMPNNKRWAIGIDAWAIQQREFDQKFSFRDYKTVTGFITAYYDLPFYDLRLKAKVGRFLGKDKGFHIDMARQFSGGGKIGASLSLTNCKPWCVGEGSFNKWVYFSMPLDPFFNSRSTRNKAGFSWSPLTKDAGTQLENGSLYDVLKDGPDQVETLRKKNWSFKKLISGFGFKSKKKI